MSRLHQVELEGFNNLLLKINQLLFPVGLLLLESNDVYDEVERWAGCFIEFRCYENGDSAQADKNWGWLVCLREVKQVAIGQRDR